MDRTIVWLAANMSRRNATIAVCWCILAAIKLHAHYSPAAARCEGTIDPQKRGDMTLLLGLPPQYSRASNRTTYRRQPKGYTEICCRWCHAAQPIVLRDRTVHRRIGGAPWNSPIANCGG